ncbi:MAG: hypothetical protein MUF54_06700 [Polyangiaceae bacterium]|nr:hypothetical protein [Polyangiaceae bacterium]
MSQHDASELPLWARKLLVGVFVLGVLPLGVYGVWSQVLTAREVVPTIQQQLLTPYASALAAGQFERAYETFTTESYRSKVDRTAYLRGQLANQDAYGEPRALVIQGCNDTKEPGRGWFTMCNVRYEGTKGEAPLSLEIVERDGRYLLDRAYLRERATDTRSEAAF